MFTLLDDLIKYFEDTIGVALMLEDWDGVRKLPMFMTANTGYQAGRISGRGVLFVICKEPMRANDITRFESMLSSRTDRTRVYVMASMDSYSRSILAKLKICFVAPFKQMYLPNFFIDFRESHGYRHLHSTDESRPLSPSAQMIAIALISAPIDSAFTSGEFAERFDVTKMTISKAYNELGKFESFKIREKGKSNQILIDGSRRGAWEELKGSMRSPVLDVFYAQKEGIANEMVRAGESALADQSMLGHPPVDTYACSKQAWVEFAQVLDYSRHPDQFKSFGQAYIRIERWMYDPWLLATKGKADCISLYLSLADESDERVQMCLGELMESQEWFMD